ncbi:hypothetical protein D3C72_1814990 [compost metagenome]
MGFRSSSESRSVQESVPIVIRAGLQLLLLILPEGDYRMADGVIEAIIQLHQQGYLTPMFHKRSHDRFSFGKNSISDRGVARDSSSKNGLVASV